MRHIFRRGSVTLIVGLLLFTGCSGGGGNLTAADLAVSSIEEMSCAQAQAVETKLNDHLAAPADSGKYRELDELGLDPGNDEQVKKVKAALRAACDDATDDPTPSASPSSVTPSPTMTATPSPSETSSATPTASPTASDTPSNSPSSSEPTPTTDAEPASYIGWDDVVSNPPVGLEDSINEHSSEIGFGWDDVTTWAETTLPSGDLIDARVVLVFDRPNLSDDQARAKTNVDQDVPVVHAGTCTDVTSNGCPSGKAVQVILAPVVLDAQSVSGLQVGSGVALTDGFPLLTYHVSER